MTRDSEKFKRINTASLDIGEIQKLLGQDEKIGFASYLIIKPHFFGFASSSLSPKFDSFCSMVNRLLILTGNGSWRFCIKPLVHQATKEEAIAMNYIGKTTIEVSHGNSLTRSFMSFLGCDDCTDLDSLEITLKPKKNRSIKRLVEKVVDCADDDGIEKLTMKAQNDAGAAMLDLYIVGRGVLSDQIGNYDESVIPSIIEIKIRENVKLTEQLTGFLHEFDDQTDGTHNFNPCSDVDAWRAIALALQGDYQLLPGSVYQSLPQP